MAINSVVGEGFVPLSSDSLSIAVTGHATVALYRTTVNGHMDREVPLPHCSSARPVDLCCCACVNTTEMNGQKMDSHFIMYVLFPQI